jgi:AraC family transcriptional activator FtrA
MNVVVVLLAGMRSYDVSVALEVFAADRSHVGVPPNVVKLVAPTSRVRLEHGMFVETGPLAAAPSADLVIVPGFADLTSSLKDLDDPPAAAVVEALRSAHLAGAQIASLCSGAFLLANTGLLDGSTATTHWSYCDLLRTLHPRVQVEQNVLYTHDGERRLWTSAGVSAGADACLAILSDHHGAAAAASVARSMVLPAVRLGGQAQYVPVRRRPEERVGAQFENLRALVRADLTRPWTLAALARAANSTPRTLQRRFTEEAAMTPSQWLRVERLAAARELLENSELTIEQIAHRVGFGGADLLRKHFGAQLTISPSRYREAFSRRAVS